MKILVDIHISPITVHFLQDLGYDAIRVNEIRLGIPQIRKSLKQQRKNDGLL